MFPSLFHRARSVSTARETLLPINGADGGGELRRSAKPGAPLTTNAVAAWFLDLYSRRMNWTGYSSHSGRRTLATLAARNAVTAGGSLRDVHARPCQP